MKQQQTVRVVLVTCGTLTEARRISRKVVTKRFAACANIVLGPVESIYRWREKVEKAREWLLILKTTAARIRDLETEIKRLHSYDVPEFVVLPVTVVSRDYLTWLTDSTNRPPKTS
ncbi:MAG TPA: divalent-cation tolerance protein CutA [Candidatus Acidoferrum sp.]|jgi:periplasmic divalent cation tolerance protein